MEADNDLQKSIKQIPTNSNSIQQIQNRCFIQSPSVRKGTDKESSKSDFNRENNNSIELGSFGKVWKVSHKRSGKMYFIKVINKQVLIQKKVIEELNKELESLYNFEHINLLRLLNHFEDEENLYLILQNINSSSSLYDLLKSKKIEESKIFIYAKQIILALTYIQSKNISCYNLDLKPESIFINEYDRVKLTDYGMPDISSIRNECSLRKNYFDLIRKININSYTAPETIENEQITDKIDIWKLGVILFELLTKGELPFKGECIEDLKNNILNTKISWGVFPSESTKNLVKNMLKRNPEERISMNDISKNFLFLQVKIPNDNPNEIITDESLINKRMNTLNNQSQNNVQNDQLAQRFKKENEILKIENENLKKINISIQLEFDNLKNKYNSLENSISFSNTDGTDCTENLNYIEHEDKYDYVNKDSQSKDNEIEEKANEILEYRSRIRLLENEIELINFNVDDAKEKIFEYENEIKKLSKLLEYEKSEKEEKINLLNSKLEELENKLFNPRASGLSKSLDFNQNNEEFVMNISVLLFDLVKEFNETIQNLLTISKEENESLMRNMRDIITSKEISLKETINKVKDGIENEVLRKSNNASNGNAINEKMGWMKKQISELIPFKLKSMNLELALGRSEKEIKLKNEKLLLIEIERDTVKGILNEQTNTLENLLIYQTNIENKLSDAKDFILKNCPDKIEDLFLIYKV